MMKLLVKIFLAYSFIMLLMNLLGINAMCGTLIRLVGTVKRTYYGKWQSV